MPNRPISIHARDAASRRFRPRWVPTLAMLVAVAIFVAAGTWQRARMHAKEALRERFDAAATAPPATSIRPGAAGDWASLRFQPVIVRGEFDAARQIYIDNRIHAGRAGYHVVAPLKLPDGTVVLVNRGWIAAGVDRAQLPQVPAPAGETSVEGRLKLPDAYFELKTDAHAGAFWQNLDPAKFAAATGLTVLPVVIEQTRPPVPDDGLVRAWPPPDFGIEKHLIYMLQWYAFAALAIALWAVTNWRRDAPRADD